MIGAVTGQHGRYRLDPSTRRQGGQAEVFRARAPGGEVAVKLALRGGEGGAWMERERRTLAALGETGRGWVIDLLDYGRTRDDRPFLVLPWVEQNLEQWLSHPRPLAARLLALERAAEAVVRLHRSAADPQETVLHRDIKPSNFLVRESPGGLQVLLADLGCAKQSALLSVVSQTGNFTPAFAPPEQGLPLAHSLEPSVDVHALGVTIYWGLTGRLPTAAMARQAYFLPEAYELSGLHQQTLERSPEEEARYQELRRRPLSDFFDLEDACSLTPDDRRRLTAALEDALEETAEDPTALAGALSAALSAQLERALQPDPGRRLNMAAHLMAACRNARREVEAVSGKASGAAPLTGGGAERAGLPATRRGAAPAALALLIAASVPVFLLLSGEREPMEVSQEAPPVVAQEAPGVAPKEEPIAGVAPPEHNAEDGGEEAPPELEPEPAPPGEQSSPLDPLPPVVPGAVTGGTAPVSSVHLKLTMDDALAPQIWLDGGLIGRKPGEYTIPTGSHQLQGKRIYAVRTLSR